MSSRDVFTQKLLERTEARKQQRQASQSVSKSLQMKNLNEPRSPLKESTNTFKLHKEEVNVPQKRMSSEGIVGNTSEKKTKIVDIYLSKDITEEAEKSKLFQHRQGLHSEYVVPNFSDRTPTKPDVGSSLKSRLENLNHHYYERLEVDQEEIIRKKEVETLRKEIGKEHKKIIEEEKSKMIQQNMFRKNYQCLSSTKENQQSVGDKKFLFEQKMKQEHDARQKEIETEKRLKQKGAKWGKDTKKFTEFGEKDSICIQSIKSVKVDKPKKANIGLPLPAKKEVEKNEGGSVPPRFDIVTNDTVPAKEDKANIDDVKHSLQKNREQMKTIAKSPLILKTNIASSNSSSISKMEHDIAKTLYENEIAIKNVNDMNFEIMKNVRARSKLSMTDLDSQRENDICTSDEQSNKIPLAKITAIEAIPETTKIYTDDFSSPQPVDCTEDTTNAIDEIFDISAILHLAEDRSKILSPKSNPKARAEKTPLRCSTMKVVSLLTPTVNPIIDIDLTPVQVDDEEYEEEPSEFTKQIRIKTSSMRTNLQQQKLSEIDFKLKEKQAKSIPQKPSRTRKNLPSYDEFVAEKREIEIQDIIANDPVQIKTIEVDNKNNEKYTKGTRQEIPNKLRRSISFTEGQNIPNSQSSGYNKHTDIFSAHSSSFDKPDIVCSKRDQIQNLLEEAASQQNIVLQASQALNFAQLREGKEGSPEVIEGEKLLLLATEKRTACLTEVNELKENDSLQYLSDLDRLPPCKATLAITDLRLPLHHEFINALRTGKMDLGVFHFVVITSCGSKNVFSTKVSSTYDKMDRNSLILNGDIFMQNISHDFTLVLRVFGLHIRKLSDQTSKTKKNANVQSPANLKSLFSKKNKEEEFISNASPQTVFRTSSFKLVGETRISLGLLGNEGKYVLTKVPSNCPLEGFIQLRVGCKPEFNANASGFLTILEDVGGYTAWNRRWSVLKDSKIVCWRYPDDENVKKPLKSVDLRYCSNETVTLLSRDKCARPHTFELAMKQFVRNSDISNLITTIDGKYTHTKHWVSADTKEDRVVWMEAINRQLSDSRAWLLRKAKLDSASNEAVEKGYTKAVPV